MIQRLKQFGLGLGIAVTMVAIPQTAQAAIINLAATLDQDQEVPTPNLVPGASGSATMAYDTDSNLLSWEILFSGLSGNALAAHFHGPARPGQTAPVVRNIGNISGLSSPMIGSLPLTQVLTEEEEQELLSGLWYINIHTALNPPGEIRGQVTIVPEPSSLGLIAMAGVSFLGYKLRRRQQSSN